MDVSALQAATAEAARAWWGEVSASPVQWAAHGAALAALACVGAGALMRTMMPLRWLAVGGNVGLLAYGMLHPTLPTAAVAAVLLPVNVWRAVEVTRLTRRVRSATAAAETAAIWLRPHMKPRRRRAGQWLFSKGDRADRLYMLAHGRLEIVELGTELEPGRVFGEVALFSPRHRRTQSVRCATDCTVLEIDEGTVRQLFFQHPAFAFHLVELLAERLGRDVERAQQRGG